MLKKTPEKTFKQGNQTFRIVATYGIDYDFARKHGQAPSFSATATIDELRGRRWVDYSGGMQHDEIVHNFPALTPYLKWHLVSTQEPMHYLANAKYWWEKMTGTSEWKDRPGDTDPEAAFRSTIVYGGIPGDRMPELSAPWPVVAAWLRDRLPKLMGHFTADMASLGVLE
jgi:hypothetical protein